MSTTTSSPQVAFFDGIGESVTPTANFTPPSGYPLSRLGEHHLHRRTRTPDGTAATTATLTWDLGVPTEVNVFMLAGSNATLDVLGRFRAADDAGFTVNVVESSPTLQPVYGSSPLTSRSIYTPPWGRVILYVHPTSITKRYFQWQQSDATNVQGYQSWAFARFGLSLQLGQTVAVPVSGAQLEGGLTDWTMTAQSAGIPGSSKQLRQHDFDFTLLTRPLAEEIQSILLLARGRRCLAIPEPLYPETFPSSVFWGEFDASWQRQADNRTSYDDKRFKISCTFREVDQ